MFFAKSDVVLLVDDSADLRRYVRGLLSPYCTIVESENGEAALKVVGTVKPNLIITDVMMPGASPVSARMYSYADRYRRQ